MSVIGPRPGLWNQDLLTAERDKYGANDVKPGLTGWAQINGRDELEIPEKAKLDGEYCRNMGLGLKKNQIEILPKNVLGIERTANIEELKYFEHSFKHIELISFISKHSLWIYLWQIMILTVINYGPCLGAWLALSVW